MAGGLRARSHQGLGRPTGAEAAGERDPAPGGPGAPEEGALNPGRFELLRLPRPRRPRRFRRARRRLARRYIRGEGIEIGALAEPLPLPRGARVRYLDRLDAAGLRRHYPELGSRPLVPVEIVDDGERLDSLAPGSLDFIVANHFIEHTEDPVGTLERHLEVLRPGGVLFMAVPDKRRTFDRERPLTTIEHLLCDHSDGAERSRAAHYLEWARFADRAPDPPARARELEARGYSIHFHVWTPATFAELVRHLRDERGLSLEVEAIEENFHEFIVVLRRPAG